MKKLTSRLMATCIIILMTSMVCHSQDWTQWRGLNRDGKVEGFQAPQTWPQQLKQVWRVTVGYGDASPALADNKLYVFTKSGDNEILQCLDATTGRQIWKSDGYPSAAISGPASSHPGPRSSVTVSEGRVFTLGAWGDVACYDARTGKLNWRNEDFKGKVPQFNTGMSPLIEADLCYTHLGGPEKGTFVAFNVESGDIKWKIEGEGPAYGSPVLLNISGTKQVLFQATTKLISFSLSDGKQLWEFATPAGPGRVNNATSPLADQNKVYFMGLNNGISALEVRKDGNSYTINKLWHNPELNTAFSTPVLKDGFLYGLTGDSRLFCLNAQTGTTAWIDTTPLQRFGSLIDTGREIIVLSSNSNFVVIRPNGQKYEQVVLIRLPGNDYYAHPVLSGSNIILKDTESLTLYTLK